MTRTIVAVYESLYAANQAVQELFEIGFSDELIDVAPRLRTKPADQALIPVTGAPADAIEPVDAIDSAASADSINSLNAIDSAASADSINSLNVINSAASADSINSLNAIDSAAMAEARLMHKKPKGTLRPEININGQSLGIWIGLGVGGAMGLTGALSTPWAPCTCHCPPCCKSAARWANGGTGSS